MKLYYFSSFLLLTLFYIVSGQNVSVSGVKTIPQTRVPDTYTITRITKTVVTPTKKICPTANFTSMEKRCNEQGGKLILDDCGYYSVCLLPCGGSVNTPTTTTNTKTLTKTLPTTYIIKDYYLKHGSYNGYIYCSCLYSEIRSNYYAPVKPSEDIGMCQRQLDNAAPVNPTEVVDPIPVTTTTTSEEVTSVPVTTGKIVPSGVIPYSKVKCQNLGGKFYMNDDGSKSVCLISCKSAGKTLPVTKTLPTTKSTKTIPSSLLPSTVSDYCACVIDLLTSNERTSTKVLECLSRAKDLGYSEDDDTTTTTTPTEDIIPTDKPTTCPTKALNNVGTLCKQYGGLLVTEGCETEICLVPCGAKTIPTKTVPTTTAPTTIVPYKTIPAKIVSSKTISTVVNTKTIPSNYIIKDEYLNHGEFNGYVYCSCVYANDSSSGYAAGINSSDMAQCKAKLPEGTDYTTINYKKKPIEVIETPTEAVETPTEAVETPTEAVETTTEAVETPIITTSKCVPQVITITEKEKETITLKETVTITIMREPTPLQCADKRAQCGGKNYKGPTCCPEGYLCRPFTSYYSECVEIGKEY